MASGMNVDIKMINVDTKPVVRIEEVKSGLSSVVLQ